MELSAFFCLKIPALSKKPRSLQRLGFLQAILSS
jgi:hypothetical protein